MLTYDVSPFEVPDAQHARAIILTPTPEGLGTDARWERETDYLTDLIIDCCRISPGSTVLDYGCGIGRLSKPLVKHGARVTGVDTSGHMLALARQYVDDDRFCAMSPAALDHIVREEGAQFDAAIAVWVLQHVKYPLDDILRIAEALKCGVSDTQPNGRLFVVNEKQRCVPTKELGWIDDGIDIRKELASLFTCFVEGKLMPSKVGEATSKSAFWALY